MNDSSDNNNSEVSKMAEDWKDLDDDLFSDVFRKKKPRETQKKVAFQQDVEGNNSLNDLLSDSNESYKTSSAQASRRIGDLFTGTGGSKKNTDGLKKSSLMEDLFGQKSPRATSQSMPNLSENEIKSTSNTTDGFILSSSSSTARESRRGRPKSTVPDDPLGLLQSQTTSEPHQATVAATIKSSAELPEWLGGAKQSPANLDKCENIPIDDVAEQQSALVQLQQQQQEHELATQLSQQTEQLNSVFETLVNSQVDRQSTLETQIKLQQARIDNYIQTLMRHSTTSISTSVRQSEDVQNLEIERNNLQHLVEILKEKHRQEIKILEESHEMQLLFMHKTVEQLESRLHRETEQLENEWVKKIERLSNDKDELEKNLKIQIDNLKVNHEQTLKDIHNRHSDHLLLIRKEYSEVVGNISHAKDIERQTIDFMSTHKTDFEQISQRLQFLFDTFQNISETIKNRDNAAINEQKKNLEQREKNLQVAMEELSNERRNFDLERKQIESTVQKLHSDTTQLSGQLEKNLELFYGREERLAMQEKALMRERELLQEQNKWERDHLQSLKETWMAEQKHHIQLLAAEKTKLEVLSSLKSNSDDMTKAELAAALATAREAAQEADRECSRWQEQNSQLLADSRRLEMREKQLTQRAVELEKLTEAALTKRDEGLRALKDAQRLERLYKNQMEHLQRQLRSQEERERQINAEKVALARERLAFRAASLVVEKPEKDVANDTLKNKIYQQRPPTQLETHFTDIVDPELLLLKLAI